MLLIAPFVKFMRPLKESWRPSQTPRGSRISLNLSINYLKTLNPKERIAHSLPAGPGIHWDFLKMMVEPLGGEAQRLVAPGRRLVKAAAEQHMTESFQDWVFLWITVVFIAMSNSLQPSKQRWINTHWFQYCFYETETLPLTGFTETKPCFSFMRFIGFRLVVV